MDAATKSSSLGWVKKTLLWCAVALIVFAVAGFFVAPPLAKSILTKKLSAILQRTVSIGKITINPFTLKVNVKGIAVKEQDGKTTFFSLDELESRASLSIVSGKIAMRKVFLKGIYLNVVRADGGRYNFSDILDKQSSAAPAVKGASKPEALAFSVQDISVIDGSVDFLDGPLNKKHTIRDFNLTVPFLSNLPRDLKTDVQPLLSLKINGTPYTIQGKTKPFADSRETTFDINIDNLDIPFYLAYLPVKIPYVVTSGQLSTKTKLSFTQYPERRPSLVVSGDLSLTKLVVNDEKNRALLSLPSLSVSLDSVEPLEQRVHVRSVSVQSPEVVVRRDEKGNLNIGGPSTNESKPTKNESAKPETPLAAVPETAGTAPGEQSLQLLVDTVDLTGGSVVFHDFSTAVPARITVDKLELKAEGITLDKDKTGTFTLSCAVNKRGRITVAGSLGVTPITTEVKIGVKDLDIRPFEPYYADKVNLTVAQGSANVQGSMLLTDTQKDGLKARFRGTASIAHFAGVDKETGEDIFKMSSLFLRDIDFQHNPSRLVIKGVALSDFNAVVDVRPDGSLNLQQIVAKEEPSVVPVPQPGKPQKAPPAGEPKKGEQQLPVKIDAVTLQNGTILFQDHSVTPHFSSELSEIGGRISGLSSSADTTADVELRGKYDGQAPLEIVGKINPLREDLYADLKVSFKDMDMSPTTPYSGKYVGYTVEKGKLSFDMQYLIEKRKLDSKNSIFIDQLTLGDRVESPDATKLPVKLAIALLRDRHGQIKLDIPVTGSLDDPKFSVWKIVVKVLLNLLAKAATAPFALIGSLFGGGEELGYVEFDYGRDTLSDANAKKIGTLAKVLQDRPTLKVDIEGHVDLERDREGLKQYLVQKKVQTQKLKDLLKKNSSGDVAVDNVKVDVEEYEKYLRLAYKAEKFPKPHSAIGLEKTIPVEEMEKLMLTNTVVKDEDLRALAVQRAAAIKEAIMKTGHVELSRMFVVEPKTLAAEKKERLKDSRVDFKLK